MPLSQFTALWGRLSLISCLSQLSNYFVQHYDLVSSPLKQNDWIYVTNKLSLPLSLVFAGAELRHPGPISHLISPKKGRAPV